MRFLPTPLAGSFVLEQERHADERGYFARTWCEEEMARQGLEGHLSQCSVSFNERRGTLRGMHWQAPPAAEAKLVRCTAGALFDVAVDLRPDSPTFGKSSGVELTPENGRALYVPRGFAHGFLTLLDLTAVEYQISTPYRPDCARGARFDDPLLHIEWPAQVRVIAGRDRGYRDLSMLDVEELRGL